MNTLTQPKNRFLAIGLGVVILAAVVALISGDRQAICRLPAPNLAAAVDITSPLHQTATGVTVPLQISATAELAAGKLAFTIDRVVSETAGADGAVTTPTLRPVDQTVIDQAFRFQSDQPVSVTANWPVPLYAPSGTYLITPYIIALNQAAASAAGPPLRLTVRSEQTGSVEISDEFRLDREKPEYVLDPSIPSLTKAPTKPSDLPAVSAEQEAKAVAAYYAQPVERVYSLPLTNSTASEQAVQLTWNQYQGQDRFQRVLVKSETTTVRVPANGQTRTEMTLAPPANSGPGWLEAIVQYKDYSTRALVPNGGGILTTPVVTKAAVSVLPFGLSKGRIELCLQGTRATEKQTFEVMASLSSNDGQAVTSRTQSIKMTQPEQGWRTNFLGGGRVARDGNLDVRVTSPEGTLLASARYQCGQGQGLICRDMTTELVIGITFALLLLGVIFFYIAFNRQLRRTKGQS